MRRDTADGSDGAAPSASASDRRDPPGPDGLGTRGGVAAEALVGRRVVWRERLAALVVFAVLSLGFFAPYLAPGRVLSPIDPKTVFPWSLGATSGSPSPARSNELMSDALLLSVPWWAWNAEQLRAGQLPLWNPFIFCGYPHLALIQSNALYPLSLPFNLAAPVRGIGMSLALHVALAGLLTFAFLRRTGLGRDAALVGGAAFALNGFFLVRFGAPSYVYTGTWLPLWLLGAEELAGPARRRRGIALVTGAAFLGFLGAHPQVWTLSAGVALAYLLMRAVGAGSAVSTGERRGRPRLVSAVAPVVAFAVASAAGLALAGFQLVPFAELVAHSLRAPVSLASAARAALPAVGIVQALLPNVFGSPVDGSYWLDEVAIRLVAHPEAPAVWGLNACGENLYTGLLPLLLALVAVVRPRDARTIFFALLAIAALAVLLGTPLLTLVYWIVPGFRFSRPDRISFVYIAAIAVLAAHGYARLAGDAPAGEAPRVGRPLVMLAVVLLAAATVAPVVADERVRGGTLEVLTRIGHRLIADPALVGAALVECGAAILVLALVAAAPLRPSLRRFALPATLVLSFVPAARFGWAFNPAQSMPLVPTTRLESLLASPERIARVQARAGLLYPANTPQLARIFDIHGSSAAALDRFGRLVEAAEPGVVVGDKYFLAFHSWSERTGRLLDLLGVGYVLADAPLPLETVWGGGGVHVYRNAEPLERFFWAERIETYASDEEGRARLFEPAFDLRHAVLVPAGRASGLPPSSEPLGNDARIQIVSYRANRIELATSSPRAALLASSEVDYPGWQARIDDDPAPVVLVNTAFRGVVVPAGEHRVVLGYEPASLRWGVALSAATALLGSGGLALARRKRAPSA
ncbi:MAG: YfhO family protein [bacterium]